ncbi:hypothetical protein ACQ4WP_08270 [Janthinobacterium sp. GB4P2]|uniref:hypothetical protein n=1 Tax=Janthinobacterium sp. GB4P2 TaxID=3424189 RepID=UPI003F1F892E
MKLVEHELETSACTWHGDDLPASGRQLEAVLRICAQHDVAVPALDGYVQDDAHCVEAGGRPSRMKNSASGKPGFPCLPLHRPFAAHECMQCPGHCCLGGQAPCSTSGPEQASMRRGRQIWGTRWWPLSQLPPSGRRRIFDVSASETIALALSQHLKVMLNAQAPSIRLQNRQAGDNWSWLVFKK